MTEQVLRTGEAARNRRLKYRSPELQVNDGKDRENMEECQHSSSMAEKSSLATTLKSMSSRTQTTLEKFYHFTGVLCVSLGILCILVPDYISYLFFIKVTTQTTAYGRVAGVYLVGVGVFYVTSGRSSPCLVPVSRIIVGTVFERLIFVNLSCLVIYVKHGGPMALILSIMTMDTILATVTYVLWAKDADTEILTSIPWAFKKVLQLCSPQNMTRTHKSSSLVKLIGYIQVFAGTAFLYRPDIVQNALQLESFDEHSKGVMTFAFMCFAVIGWLHILTGSSDSFLFNVACVFYRFFFSIPLNYYLEASSRQTAPFVAMCFVYFDAFVALSVGILLLSEK